MPRIEGQCSPGGPLEATHVPVPKVGPARDGSDIASRMAARTNRVSPLGPLPTTEQVREAEVRAQRQPDISRRRFGRPQFNHAEAIRLHEAEGLNLPAIAARLGVSRTSVAAALDKAGVQRRDGRKKK